MRKRASRLWRRYLCHCPITSFPFMSYPDRQMAGPQVGTLASVSVLCSSYSLCFSLRRLQPINRPRILKYLESRENKLILLGALLRRMEITGFSQRLAVSLEVSELKTVLYIGLSDGDDCAGRSPRVANVLILQYCPLSFPFQFSITSAFL